MNTFKRAKVVMLPTEKATVAYSSIITYGGKNLAIPIKDGISPSGEFGVNHLYILYDEEIKEGDWFINEFNKLEQANLTSENLNIANISPNCKKIIATTDKSLMVYKSERTNYGNENTYNSYDHKKVNLPEPSQSFIEVFVREYNKGNVISDVLVEWEEYNRSTTWEYDEPEISQIKVNPKDNTITIKKVKDSWAKDDEELKLAFEKFACAVYGENYKTDMSFKKRAELMSNKWIKDNL
jgi:hypothetical protein